MSNLGVLAKIDVDTRAGGGVGQASQSSGSIPGTISNNNRPGSGGSGA